jgi:predicted DsbA family dithiol-disulfide isomerase
METMQQHSEITTGKQQEADQVDIAFYTDPLCCWSYAMDIQLQKLVNEYGEKMTVRHCMGGMIPDWNNYNDEVNAVTRPIQMGPVWMEASHRSGVYMYDRIWKEDPPASSYPACIAVKCAGLQSENFEYEYLRLVRKAVMKHGKNIARNSVLFEVAESMPVPFDAKQFREDLLSGAGKPAFHKDLEEVRSRQIFRFPTLTISSAGQGMIITGYKTFEHLRDIINKIPS